MELNRINIPNLLTFARIVLLPVILVIFYLPYDWARPLSCAIFLMAAITDWLDGYLARKWEIESAFGAFLDPVADKLMVATVLIMLVEDASTWLLTVPAIVIIGREITISALREWMASVGSRAKVAVSYLGKIKTTAQITALAMLLFRDHLFGLPIYNIGMACLYLAAVLTIWSMVDYLVAAFSSDDQ
jgi:CDP-diacylglycerol--glycerol-3-phosphate 3-phosphatidyltransferase